MEFSRVTAIRRVYIGGSGEILLFQFRLIFRTLIDQLEIDRKFSHISIMHLVQSNF
jgi:hypothetical protein